LVRSSTNALGLRHREESPLNTKEFRKMEEELLKLEEQFAEAIIENDPGAIERLLTDDWIIINADGGIIDKERFLGVIKSGTLTHEMMESDNMRVRVYGDSAVVTALTRTKGKFMGQEFSTHERATDFFVRLNGQWRCVLTQLTRFTKPTTREAS